MNGVINGQFFIPVGNEAVDCKNEEDAKHKASFLSLGYKEVEVFGLKDLGNGFKWVKVMTYKNGKMWASGMKKFKEASA